ncbi:MAG: acyl-CoA dehydrogenase family protein [Candidatus Dormibacteria bacterium]
MDFSLTPDETTFRDTLRAWLAENAPKRGQANGTRFADEDLPRLRDWQKRLYQAGYIGLSWPKAFGGQGATLMEQAIFNEEIVRAQAPPPINVIGLNMAGPTIIARGTDAQRSRHLANILSADEIWCQGFSEPDAGSDLAALKTKAVLDGDHYVVNGQKVWTSYGHVADWCILLARTSPEKPKHEGITYFLMDMHAPGVEVRPLRQITGHAEFNELFLTDVRIPVENVIDKVDAGWSVAMTTLMHERATLSFELQIRSQQALEHVIELARRIPRNGGRAADDPLVRQKIAQFVIEVQTLKYNSYRGLSTIQKTGVPGPEGSVNKLFWSEVQKRMMDFALELEGPYSQLMHGSDYSLDDGAMQFHYLRSKGNSIEAGTSEVLRNIIAERVLGLPKGR